ncbi:MAG: GGDEF domain-containing protein [Alteromonas sp.]|uniref:GGDEF domain-containing protein n=1 Tax=unclassified Alteromonas TaxID=2614992 RepID=UPI0009032008|nr:MULTISPECIES: GGDEF domain-containing protein [unclassified Alteromonas]APE07753.1 GGDEF domain-containing protein [Alteromonas sp. RW2A1]AUC90386.1 GGDEF domain-containing protein [Alteromonas sp. MB-3u-76]MAI66080.1 GGDEF domain-containing protein [Alteromonas sp.]
MKSYPLNQHVFRLSAGLVLLSTVAILFSVWSSTTEHAKRELAESLEVARYVVAEVFSNREEQLFTNASVLTDDFGFKSAVASQDNATIASTLENHGNRVGADVMALLTLSGDITSSTSDGLLPGQQFPHPQLVDNALKQGGDNAFIVLNNELYQVLLLLVEAPNPIAIAAIGFKIDAPVLERLKSITLSEVAIIAKKNDSIIFKQSTLSEEQDNVKRVNGVEGLSWLSFIPSDQSQYITQDIPLFSGNDTKITLELSESAETLFTEFATLQKQISIIAALLLAASLIIAALFAKRISRPLRRLSKISQEIAAGFYNHKTFVTSHTTEIAALSDSFQSMQSNIQMREEQIQYQATHDLLTGLSNRYHITEILNNKFKHNETLQVIGINILGFRNVNDVFGYQNGDLCLHTLAGRLSALGGVTARLNGGEFLWIPTNPLTNEDIASVQAELAAPIQAENVVITLRLSLGVLKCPEDANDALTLLKRLAITLDHARHLPTHRVHYSANFDAEYTRRISIITELKLALSEDSPELSLVYQPKLDLTTNTVSHAEALMRWNSEKLGFVGPDEFILIAEQAGLIGAVTEWVIKRAIKDTKNLLQSDVDVCVAINLSAKDILNKTLLSDIKSQIVQAGLTASQLAFEITESDLVSDAEGVYSELALYRDAGFALAIDDFGTGYSSLSYLKSLPVNELKIDKSFVLNLDKNQSDQQIVKTIIDLAHNFDLKVIAEGVETQGSLALLQKWGCNYAQGYLLSRPVPVESFIQWYKDNINTDWFSL